MRCTICDSSDTGQSNFNQEHKISHSFYPDPNRTGGFICESCAETHIEVMNEYYEEDEECHT